MVKGRSRIMQSVDRQSEKLLRTGSRFQKYDQVRQRHFWSTYLMNADANGYIPQGVYPTFTTPVGQAGQGFAVAITDRETNWAGANRVPDNQNVQITEIGVGVLVIPGDVGVEAGAEQVGPGQLLSQILSNTLVAITYLTNTVELGFAYNFSQASGPTVGLYEPVSDYDATPGTRVAGRFALNGFAAPALRRRFKIPILLGHGETFSFPFLVPRSYFLGADAAVYLRFDFWATESFVEKS